MFSTQRGMINDLQANQELMLRHLQNISDNVDRLSEVIMKAANTPDVEVEEPSDGIEMFAFDWAAAKAFSIERVKGKTIIGYVNAEGKNGEWNFSCNEAAHIELVKEFIEYKKAKAN